MGSEIREIPYVGIDFSAIHKTDFSACPLPKRNFLSLLLISSLFIRDKRVEMTHLNETIYGTGIVASYQAYPMQSGVFYRATCWPTCANTT